MASASQERGSISKNEVMENSIDGQEEEKDQTKDGLSTIKNYMRAVGVGVEGVKDRDKWRSWIEVADPKHLGRKRKRKINIRRRRMNFNY